MLTARLSLNQLRLKPQWPHVVSSYHMGQGKARLWEALVEVGYPGDRPHFSNETMLLNSHALL